MGPVRLTPFAVAVLTGGASRRMGRDKASLPIDGVPMAERVALAATDAGAMAIAAVGRPVPGCHHVPDDHPGEGPLGGVLTALHWSADRAVVVVACDLLEPSPDAIVSAAEVRASTGAAVAVPVVGGRAQWLHACWSPDAAAALTAAFDAGERAVHRAAERLAVVRYPEANAAALADADTEADLPSRRR